MKRAAASLHDFTTWLSATVGLEGAFVLLGTGLLSAGAERLVSGGALLVAGSVALLIGIALVVPRKER